MLLYAQHVSGIVCKWKLHNMGNKVTSSSAAGHTSLLIWQYQGFNFNVLETFTNQ